jgi:hypothetical protein
MAQHVKILALLHIVLSSLTLAGGLIVLLVFGGLGLVGATDLHQSDPGFLGLFLLGGVGSLIFLILLVVALPGLIGGIGLLSFKPWARILMIITSALDLLGFPFHTALGIYGLWVLFNRETEQLFSTASYPAMPRV